MKKGYSKDGLFALGPQRVFAGESLKEIVFPLGGIGTGSVGLTGLGALTDWEIFNRPNFGGRFPKTFPAIWAREKGKEPVCRILQGPLPPPYIGQGLGDPHHSGEGFPHMDGCTFKGEYPFAWIDFKSRKLPVKVQLEAYNPYIPSNPDDSGFPAAILKYTVTNKTRNPVDVTVAWSLMNAIGDIGTGASDKVMGEVEFGLGKNLNEYVEDGGLRGLFYTSKKWEKAHARFGSMALVTPNKNVTVMKQSSRAPGFASQHEFWDTFSVTGRLPEHDYGLSDDGRSDPGALGVRIRLKPGESKVCTFYITWYFPNFEKYWHGHNDGVENPCSDPENKVTWKNYYAHQFGDALDAAKQLHANQKRLYAETKRFHDALFSSTFPPFVIDAVSSQMAILKTATCLRLPDGTFYGYEGCKPGSGCCHGSCTHVWNYQQALPFLFPSLERSMRSADYKYNFQKDGGMGFRILLPLGVPPTKFQPCTDGQMGGIIKTYRDWKISGDDGWLKTVWPSVKRALEYAWVKWDPEKRGVMHGIQHNTYDVEFLGPNPMIGCYYLGALVAAAEMAHHLGEPRKAKEYRDLFDKGSAWIEANLFNGEYYVQKYDPKEAPQHQFGEGCLSDQVVGQWLSSLSGLGYVLDKKRVTKALRSIFKYNWRADLSDHANAQRVYAVNDEAGLLLCSWPNGGRPAVPFIYSDEVWTGIEYQVASHCIMEGLVKEGLAIVKGVRDRHDGIRRNPWDECECGHHYARAMASYALVPALSGFTFDMGLGAIGFEPRINPDNFKAFWTLDGVWGTYTQKGKKAALDVLWGKFTLSRLDLPGFAKPGRLKLTVGKRAIKADADSRGSIILRKALRLKAGQTLTISL
ncbi:MAG TPA: hypothetical protein HPP83_05810 [Candidatus Hydrogenedentes bacterium]|nr:hypothetical protein [Candidatus Hydrogenedentota bacterium]